MEIASQPVASSGSDFLELSISFIRGVHAYKDLWEPRIGEVLQLQQEPDNSQDKLGYS